MKYSDLPIELSIGGVYCPPLLFAALLGTVAAAFVGRFLNDSGLVRYIWHPPLFFVALSIICTVLIGLFIIPV